VGLFGKRNKDAVAAAGLYGKHPSASDFLRLNAGSLALRALDEWLSSALIAGQRSGPEWASGYSSGSTLSFVFPHGSGVLTGALAPSTDRSGRQFPLVVFGELPIDLAARERAWLPGCAFLDEAAAVLKRRTSLSKDALLDAAARLVPPGPTGLAEARRRLTGHLERLTWGAASEEMFGSLGAGERAIAALEAACRAGGSFVVACPVGANAAGGAAMWARAVQQTSRGKLQPGMLWDGKMLLLFFGKFTARALLFFWRPDAPSASDLYDLRTVEAGHPRSLPANEPVAAWLEGTR